MTLKGIRPTLSIYQPNRKGIHMLEILERTAQRWLELIELGTQEQINEVAWELRDALGLPNDTDGHS